MNLATPDRIDLTDEQATVLARTSRLLMAAAESGSVARIALLGETERIGATCIDLPTTTLRALSNLFALVANQQNSFLYPVDAEITTGQAADILGVSRMCLITRLDAGDLPFRRIGRRRYLRLGDVVAHKNTLLVKRQAADDAVLLRKALNIFDE